MLEIQRKPGRAFYALLSLPATAMGFALCVQISALSWILSTQYHLEIHEVGYVWPAGPLAGIIAQPVVGFVSDKVWLWGGRRRPFIIVGGLLAGLMILLLPFLGGISRWSGVGVMWVAIAVALTLDLAINVGFNPTRSIIADVTREGEARTLGYTWMQTVSGFFGVMAYVVGAVFGNMALIYLGAALVVVLNVIPALMITEPRDLGQSGEGSPGPDRERRTQPGRLWQISLAHAFTWLGVQTMFVYLFAYVKHAMDLPDGGDASIGRVINVSFLILNTVGFLLPVLVLQPVCKRIGTVRTHAVCIALMAAGYAGILLLGRTPGLLYAGMAVVGIGWAATVSLPFAIMSRSVSRGQMGFFMGLFNLAVVIPQLVASGLLGKWISAAPDKSIVFGIAAGSLAVSAVLWFLVSPGDEEPASQSPAHGGHA